MFVIVHRTVKKMSFYGSCWLDQVQNDISMENMPQSIGKLDTDDDKALIE